MPSNIIIAKHVVWISDSLDYPPERLFLKKIVTIHDPASAAN